MNNPEGREPKLESETEDLRQARKERGVQAREQMWNDLPQGVRKKLEEQEQAELAGARERLKGLR